MATNPLQVTQDVTQPSTVTPIAAPLADGTVSSSPSSTSANPTGAAQTGVTNANLTTASQPASGLVANNVASLIDQNSPLMQRAAAKAAEQSNARGMLNSSMAVGDAQNAVIANATPIAQSDAASTNQFALTNAQAANQSSQFNAGSANTVGASNTAASNTAANLQSQQAAQAALQTQQIGATATQNTQLQQSNTVQQANQSLQQAASTHDQQVAAIMADPNMSSDAKNAAMATLNANYMSFQQSYKAMAGLSGVTQLLNFSASGSSSVPGGTPTPGSNAAYTTAAIPTTPRATNSGITYNPNTGLPANAASWDTMVTQLKNNLAATPATVMVGRRAAPNPAYIALQNKIAALGPRPAA